MNYQRIYNSLIERAKNRAFVEGYSETHHILPRCLGGTDSKDNLVQLTAREHFIAHILLVKIFPGESKLILAVLYMTQYTSERLKQRMNNKMYGWLKERFSEHMRISQTGQNNSQYGTRWICNQDGLVKKISSKDAIPSGWCLGRKVKQPKSKKKRKQYNPFPKFLEEHSGHFHLYERVLAGDSLRNVAKDFGQSHVSLSNQMKIYKSWIASQI